MAAAPIACLPHLLVANNVVELSKIIKLGQQLIQICTENCGCNVRFSAHAVYTFIETFDFQTLSSQAFAIPGFVYWVASLREFQVAVH